MRFKTFNKVYTMSDENKNIENKQEENRNKCEDKKSCWVKTQPTSSTNTCLATWLYLQDRVKNSKMGY